MIQSLSFWILLLVGTLVYWQLPLRWRHGFLGLVSLGYLATLSLYAAGSLLVLAAAFYFLLGPPAWRRWSCPLLILVALGQLAYFKYIPAIAAAIATGRAGPQILVPLGMSFFTFKLIHYAVEVTRGNITDRSWSRFFCYITLFPIFTAGPIERYDHFLANQTTTWNRADLIEGLMRIAYGLIKKFVLADVILRALMHGRDVQMVLQGLTGLPVYKVWGFFLLQFINLYLDFSGYSDIAIGASRLFGLRIGENFNYPIVAENIGVFWKRWHMSLANWCQAYVYMPTLGLTRNPYLALYATMGTMGLWHAGALNYICWGLYHATGLATFITWTRYKRRRGWTFGQNLPGRLAGNAATLLFVSSAMCFTLTLGQGIYPAVRLLAKLVCINLPA